MSISVVGSDVAREVEAPDKRQTLSEAGVDDSRILGSRNAAIQKPIGTPGTFAYKKPSRRRGKADAGKIIASNKKAASFYD